MTSPASRGMTRGLLPALALTLPITVTVPAFAVSYTFQTVNFPGDTFTQLLGVNDLGVIAGHHGSGAAGHPNQGFRLVLPDTFTSENFPGSAQTQVIGINSAGDTGGFYIDAGGVTHGFTKVGAPFTTLDAPGTAFNQILGMNDNGQAAGYSSMDPAGATLQQAFIHQPNLSFTLLAGFLPAGTQNNQATDINNFGGISGFYVDAGGFNHGFLLTPMSLGFVQRSLDFPGSTFTQALGLNNQFQVVGTYMDAGGMMHGFVWNRDNGTFQSVDDPNGTGGTTINGINDNGDIVGFFVDAAGNTDGFFGTPVPEPSTVILLISGLAGLLAARRRIAEVVAANVVEHWTTQAGTVCSVPPLCRRFGSPCDGGG